MYIYVFFFMRLSRRSETKTIIVFVRDYVMHPLFVVVQHHLRVVGDIFVAALDRSSLCLRQQSTCYLVWLPMRLLLLLLPLLANPLPDPGLELDLVPSLELPNDGAMQLSLFGRENSTRMYVSQVVHSGTSVVVRAFTLKKVLVTQRHIYCIYILTEIIGC